MTKSYTVSAIECTQNNKHFYTTTINSKILREICFISRRDDDPKKGFQRLLNIGRAKNIANYLDEQRGVIPSAILLSAQDKAKVSYEKASGKLSFNPESESFLVIDGQHRLYGLEEAKNDYEMPVIIFTNLKTSEEVKLFIDINTTQKGVSSALLLDIKQMAGTETKKEELQRELFNLLNSNSPLAGLLSATKSQKGKISRAAFNEATLPIFENGPLSGQDIEIIYMGVNNFLEASEYAFTLSKSSNAKISKTILFKALFMIFDEVMRRCLQDYGNFRTENIKETLEPLSTLPFDDYTGTNKATLQRIVSDMRSEINKYKVIGKDMF